MREPSEPGAEPPSVDGDRRRLLTGLRHQSAGREHVAAELLPLVYERLRRMAHAKISRLPAGQTLQTTALVHEAWLDLVGHEDPGWDSQAHFLAAAATAMRDIIVDRARRKARLKHGGDRARVDHELDEILVPSAPVDDVLAMNEALDALRDLDARKAKVVELRCFGGLTMPEIARVLGASLATVEREWRFARSWIQSRVEG